MTVIFAVTIIFGYRIVIRLFWFYRPRKSYWLLHYVTTLNWMTVISKPLMQKLIWSRKERNPWRGAHQLHNKKARNCTWGIKKEKPRHRSIMTMLCRYILSKCDKKQCLKQRSDEKSDISHPHPHLINWWGLGPLTNALGTAGVGTKTQSQRRPT